MLLGPACSLVAMPAAATLEYWNLLQVGNSALSDSLSDKEYYKYFYRTNPPSSAMNPPRLAILREFDWNRVAIIHENNEYFANHFDITKEYLRSNGIDIVTSESFDAGQVPREQLRNMKDKDARIIFASAYIEPASILFCEIYKQSMYGERYVWIIESWLDPGWWELNLHVHNCTLEEMREVASLHVGVDFLSIYPIQDITISGLTPNEYEDMYYNRTNQQQQPGEEYAPYAYDGLWTIAMVLNETQTHLEQTNSSLSILDFDYNNTHHIRELFENSIKNLNFKGISGTIQFNRNGDRFGNIKLEQLIDNEIVTIGIYYQNGELVWESEKRITFTGDVPIDGALYETVYIGIRPVIYLIFSSLSAVGVIVACAFLVFNIKNRKRKLIRLSSPNVNNVIATGCIVCYGSVMLFGLDQNIVESNMYITLCMLRAWTLSIGYSMAFGGLFLKTWRVYLIFRKLKIKKKIVQDWHLFGLLTILLLIDLIYLFVWSMINPFFKETKTFPPEIVNQDLILLKKKDSCDCKQLVQWTVVLYVYKGLIMLYGAKLAWETRKVSMQELNDSKYIGLSIYNVAIIVSIAVPLTYVLEDEPEVVYSLVAVAILYTTTCTMCLVFVPKIIVLRGTESDTEVTVTTFNRSRAVAPETFTVSIEERVKQKEHELQKLRRDMMMQKEFTDIVHRPVLIKCDADVPSVSNINTSSANTSPAPSNVII
ncbi:gamma-aminobutyric acid type B receptor subunit 2-like [Antedon mediterranea]|uniref:gamma-aminobutyric acid type B receptor subunit 2-like n=1 Tax=Antedon mediterranea TaxID=105859 RepID=UPI003AF813CD